MLIRLTNWFIIILLMLLQARKKKTLPVGA
jgi:hypothetical protein